MSCSPFCVFHRFVRRPNFVADNTHLGRDISIERNKKKAPDNRQIIECICHSRCHKNAFNLKVYQFYWKHFHFSCLLRELKKKDMWKKMVSIDNTHFGRDDYLKCEFSIKCSLSTFFLLIHLCHYRHGLRWHIYTGINLHLTIIRWCFAKTKWIVGQNDQRSCQFQALHYYHDCLFFIILIRKLFSTMSCIQCIQIRPTKKANQMFNAKINNMTQQNLYTTSKWDSLGLLDSKYECVCIHRKREPNKILA